MSYIPFNSEDDLKRVYDTVRQSLILSSKTGMSLSDTAWQVTTDIMKSDIMEGDILSYPGVKEV